MFKCVDRKYRAERDKKNSMTEKDILFLSLNRAAKWKQISQQYEIIFVADFCIFFLLVTNTIKKL